MRENFPEVTVLDADFDDCLNVSADRIGFSLQFVSQETSFWQIFPTIDSFNVVIGGPHGGKMPIPISPFVTHHYGPGEDFLAGKHIHIRDLALPNFSHDEIKRYWLKDSSFGYPLTHKWMTLQTSRGCHGYCGWCTMPSFWGRWEGRDVNDISRYLDYLISYHGIVELLLLDDNVSYDRNRFISLIEAFDHHSMLWQCPNGIYLRSLLDNDVLEALKDSLCTYMALPLEAGNAESAKLMGLDEKWLSHDEATELIAKLREAIPAIKLKGLFVIGYPGETEANVRDTFAYGNSLTLDERTFSIAQPHKGSRMWRTASDNGWLIDGPETPRTSLIDTPMLCRHTLERLKREDRDAAIARRKT
jgi:radical SAM superfamily enzyme YgiQ (UPF0313 family)